jgi:hypothetical protein
MKSGSVSAFCSSLAVFSHAAKARPPRYIALRTFDVLQNSSYFAFFNAPSVVDRAGSLRGPGGKSRTTELASHSTIGVQVEFIWTLPRLLSLIVSE